MVKVQTTSGFVCNVDERKAKDWNFLEALVDCENENESIALRGITKVVPLLLGTNEFEKLKKHVEKDGFTDVEVIMSEFKEILEQIGQQTKK
jgi:hypothetical protein